MRTKRGFTLLEVVIVLVVVAVLGGVGGYYYRTNTYRPAGTPGASASPTPPTPSATSAAATASPAVSAAVMAGQQLSHNECTGTGNVPLSYPPVKPADINIIEPYGLMVGGHVTPVDHQYYWAKKNTKDANDVMALADGRLVDIEYRDHNGQGPIPGDYRVIISYSCTFFSYFDLATSLTPDIASQLPSGWEKSGHTSINIPVKAGQVVAKMGGQSLDFAVWDMTYNNPKLLVPSAYMAELWKVHTVPPLDHFTDSAKASLLPYYVRQTEPRDGTYAYDLDGKLIGTWFKQGTNGYHAQNNNPPDGSYWAGHLSIVPDFIDTKVTDFSIGNYQGAATQFVLPADAADPATVGVDTGLVKYQLIPMPRYRQANGNEWDAMAMPTSALTLPTTGASVATVLVQLTDAHTLKVEIFPGKTAAQVSAFDGSAIVYTRDGN